MWKMFSALFGFSLTVVITVLFTRGLYYYFYCVRTENVFLRCYKDENRLNSIYFLADAMSDPQIGVQIGEIHNENTGGGNVQNSTASHECSGYPLVSPSLLFIQLVCVFQCACLIWSGRTQKSSIFISK